MENPHYVALTIAIGILILGELLLWRFPKKPFIKYIPSILGMIGSIVFAVITYQRIPLFGDYIHYLFFSVVLFCLSGIISVIMSARKPFKFLLNKTEGQHDEEVGNENEEDENTLHS
ncbi:MULTISPECIES: hypothetical protein [Bacillaceae]|uniref:Uncharacterized protein n=1 Tax=Evansella alkalicola TaxID=745819 RepID=A0ABS6JPX3_9BACI|nr:MULTISPECIES: hypothetical protein [Bacillaceae]MBU9720613.1 hypothetical protein [Bacillus alkalicola]